MIDITQLPKRVSLHRETQPKSVKVDAKLPNKLYKDLIALPGKFSKEHSPSLSKNLKQVPAEFATHKINLNPTISQLTKPGVG